MKRTMAIILSMVLLLFTFCACTDDENVNLPKNGIDDAIIGTWYGPSNNPVLNINSDCTGALTYDDTEYTAEYSAVDNVFTASSDGYYINGEYIVDQNTLTVSVEYNEETYTIIFTREEVILPEELIGSHIYKLGDDAYEIVIGDDDVICKGIPYPPSAEYEYEDIYITPGFPHDTNTPEGEIEVEYQIYKKPPTDVNKPFSASPTSAPNEDDTSAKSEESAKPEESDKSTKPSTDNKENKPAKPKDFVPETISVNDGKVTVEQDGEKLTTTKGGGSLVGTWTSAQQEGYAYIFGYTSTLPYTVTYTFNADGTGTVTALFFTGTLTWSLDGNKLDLTVSMLGDVDSGTAYVTLMGDTLCLENLDGDVFPMARQ